MSVLLNYTTMLRSRRIAGSDTLRSLLWQKLEECGPSRSSLDLDYGDELSKSEIYICAKSK